MNRAQPSSHHLTRHIITFGRVLRRAGLPVGTGQIMDALRAIQIVGLWNRDDVYQAFSSIFVTRRDHFELFDQAFDLFWRAPARLPALMSLLLPQVQAPDRRPAVSPRVKQAMQENTAKPPAFKPKRSEPRPAQIDVIFTYSPTEILRKKDFAEFTAEETIEAKKMLEHMHWPIQPYLARRKTSDPAGRFLDMRQTIRRCMRHHGEFVHLRWLGKTPKTRPIVILCDISGSMERYSRMLLHFMHAISEGMQRVETFVFGTRLTRITRYLRQKDIDQAVAEVARAVNDWAGGTRIGEAIKQFNYVWARRVLRNGAVVMIISDGWDRGDISLLKREMQRLSRSCFRLIWLNPLLGFESYQPLTRGMQAALPYVDDFLPVHNLESLEQLGKHLASLGRPSIRTGEVGA